MFNIQFLVWPDFESSQIAASDMTCMTGQLICRPNPKGVPEMLQVVGIELGTFSSHTGLIEAKDTVSD